jgi:Diacylglycerol kinase catalytic domain
MSARRLEALLALILALASVILAVISAVVHFPRGLIVLACLVVALGAALFGVLRRGMARVLGLGIAVVALAVAVILLLGRDPLLTVAIVVAALAALAAARAAFSGRAELPSAPAPSRAVMFYNIKSGGGKAERFRLAEEARRRGIEPIELTPDTTLESLVDAALARGADGLAMAGGDGSQAVVAAAAARASVPYACIPAGTRNHLALDLGVDRDDPVGALDAFVDGRERCVDLAEVNGRVFVNNVSLGLYAQAVQSSGYRNAKLRTLLDTVPDFAPSGHAPALRWSDPEGGRHEGGIALLVSNNPYRLGRAIGAGTRPRMDRAQLGVAVIGPRGGVGEGLMQLWSESSLEVDSDVSLPAGIDGESAVLEPPVGFAIRPAALRVRIAPSHPGCSPSAMLPESVSEVPGALARIAFGRSAPAAPPPSS